MQSLLGQYGQAIHLRFDRQLNTFAGINIGAKVLTSPGLLKLGFMLQFRGAPPGPPA